MSTPDDLIEAETRLRSLTPTAGITLGGQWYASQDITHDAALLSRLVTDHATQRSIEVRRFAASLFFQRYCHRISSAAVGLWVLTGRALDFSAPQVQVCVRDASPVSIQVLGQPRPRDTADELVAGLIEQHLIVLAAGIKSGFGLGMPNLWGNIAASIGQAARALSRIRDAEEVLTRVSPILETNPRLERMGSFRIMEGPKGKRLFYDRLSCCHWHEIPDGKLCSYCSLLTHEERTERFTAAMADE